MEGSWLNGKRGSNARLAVCGIWQSAGIETARSARMIPAVKTPTCQILCNGFCTRDGRCDKGGAIGGRRTKSVIA